MSNKLARVKKASRKAVIPQDFRAQRTVEVVSEEDLRSQAQKKTKAQAPKSFFDSIPTVKRPLTVGAKVSLETFLGFLEAAGTVLDVHGNFPILSSARIRLDASDMPRLIVEAGSFNVWTAVVIEAEMTSADGFQAVMPVVQAKNVLRALRKTHPKVVVGVDKHGVCIGPHTVSFGGQIGDYPSEPSLVPYEARAAIPATYIADIVNRVICARDSKGRLSVDMSGILLDFDTDPDGICYAVATDGHRAHILRLPRVVADARKNHIRATPPSLVVDAGMFRYLKAVVNNEWVAAEFSATQLVAKGEDFIVVAKARVADRDDPLKNWRKISPNYDGFWVVDSSDFVRVLKSATAEVVSLSVVGDQDLMTVTSSTENGRFREDLSIRSFDGVSTWAANLNRKYLLDAVNACKSGLVRLGMDDDPKHGSTSAVIVSSDDELFSAVIMPVRS